MENSQNEKRDILAGCPNLNLKSRNIKCFGLTPILHYHLFYFILFIDIL